MELTEERKKELFSDIEGLKDKAASLVEQAETAEPDAVEGLKSQMDSLVADMKPLEKQYVESLRTEAMKDMKSQLTTLGEAVSSLGNFDLNPETGTVEPGVYGEQGQKSWFADIAGARKGSSAAYQRLTGAMSDDMKAMVESDDSRGGFLVPEETIGGLQPLRDQRSVLRGLFNTVTVSGDSIRIASQTSGLLAGWVAELAEKPLSDMTFGELTAHVFTAAGMSVASNQLLADAKWSVDQLIFNDLAKRLAIVEETAFIAGDGEGQPVGILNTPGVDAIAPDGANVEDLLDAIIDQIMAVHEDHLMPANGILMHPRVWARIIKARSPITDAYLVGAGANPFGRNANDAAPGTAGVGLVGSLFGTNVYCSGNVPTDIEGDQSAVIVGDFSEGLILDRQGVTTDTSEHVFFTTNQTIFRAEERVGFTAGRDPKAFKVIGGEDVLPA